MARGWHQPHTSAFQECGGDDTGLWNRAGIAEMALGWWLLVLCSVRSYRQTGSNEQT